jgi:hypothetical protein
VQQGVQEPFDDHRATVLRAPMENGAKFVPEEASIAWSQEP